MITLKNSQRVTSEANKALNIISAAFKRDDNLKIIGIQEDFGHADLHNLFNVLVDVRDSSENVTKRLELL